MADRCAICETVRPEGGTNHLVLGDDWIEFCGPCGDKEKLRNVETGEEVTVKQLFDRLSEDAA